MGRVLEAHRACAASADRNGKPIALVESVKQDRKNHITRFEQEFVEGRGKRRDPAEIHAWRSGPCRCRKWCSGSKRPGFEVTALLGDYQGGPWDLRAEVWIILARRG